MEILFEKTENTKRTHCFSDETLDTLREIFYKYETEPLYEYFDNVITVAPKEKLMLVVHDESDNMTVYKVTVYRYTDKDDFLDIIDTIDDMITREDYEEDADTTESIDNLFN